jgi:HYR domain
MKRKVTWSLIAGIVLLGAFYTQNASSSANKIAVPEPVLAAPVFATILDVDRTDDTAAATACSAAPNDCSLRGAIIAANADLSATPVIINLQPATTYNLTLTNATQENAAATGDLDITTALHSVTIIGGGSSTIIDAAGLTSGNMRDRAFQITGSGVTAIFQDVVIQNGRAADDGSSGASTNPASQNSTRAGGGILNGAGIDVNLVAVNGGGTVTLDNVTIQSCQVLGKGDDIVNEHRTLDAWGGGLASLGATGNVIITGSTLTGNSALGGNGGTFNNGNGSGARGGAIYFGGGTLDIDGSRIDNNDATGGKGADTNLISNQQNGGQGGTAQGGGAWVAGTATINNTTFESCAATGGNAGNGQNAGNAGGESGGGGLYSVGSVTVTNSTFNQNNSNGGRSGDSFGPDCFGAHQSLDGGAARGGAILADGGSLVVNTATLANNSANGGDGGDGGKTNGGGPCAQTTHGAGGLAHGGAITNNNAATLNIKHGTISGNSAQAGNTGVNQAGANLPPRLVAEGTGGGIRVGPGTVTLENTIIAGNSAANGLGDTTGAPIPGPNVDGAVTSNGHNLLGIATEATGFTGPGDQTNANAMLAPLADNGGPTETMELLPGSDATDAGVAAGATLDQRGMPRTVDDPGVPNEATSDGTDIGAYEGEVPCVLTCPDDIVADNDPGECGAVVTYTEPSGESCGTVTCDHPSGSFFPVGDTLVTCTSTAGPSCSFTVTVNDTEDPVITTGGPFTLWSPNHQYETFDVTDLVTSVSDNCDPGVGIGSVVITSVSSDESDNANADGNTINDIVIAADCKSVQLRSERKGDGNGRVYTITMQVTDTSGNTSTATVIVTVPHSQNGSPAVDDGPAHTVSSGCP